MERERFAGWGVMGLPFASGHVLGLRCWSASSIGPPYTAVWHRSPNGRWSFWSTEAPEVSCSRYTGELTDDSGQTPIEVEWVVPDRLTVRTTSPELSWDVRIGSTRASRLLSAVARRLPGWMLTRRIVLRAMGPLAGRLLGVGPLALTGHMPNGQCFRLVPSAVRPVVASTASLDGQDLGPPAPLPAQATIGDFRIPQRGLLASGVVDFDPFDSSRHSSRVARP